MDNPRLLPPLTLAYVGDAVYELHIRRYLLESGRVKVNDLHKSAVRYVRARGQALALAELQSTLTEEEQDIVRRGRNAKGHGAPKGSDAAEYAAATSYEALVGYLYLAGRAERLQEILDHTVRCLNGQ